MAGRRRNRLDASVIEGRYVVDLASGCWRWLGPFQTAGYGQTEIDGRRWLAHRVSWHVHRGGIPRGAMVLHRCDNPQCINPDHLFIGDARANLADAIAKGRHLGRFPDAAVRKVRRRHLTDDDVRAIRASTDSVLELARRYGISHVHASLVRRRLRKALVPDHPA